MTAHPALPPADDPSEPDQVLWQAFCYVAGELSAAEIEQFEVLLGESQPAREALAQAVALFCALGAGRTPLPGLERALSGAESIGAAKPGLPLRSPDLDAAPELAPDLALGLGVGTPGAAAGVAQAAILDSQAAILDRSPVGPAGSQAPVFSWWRAAGWMAVGAAAVLLGFAVVPPSPLGEAEPAFSPSALPSELAAGAGNSEPTSAVPAAPAPNRQEQASAALAFAWSATRSMTGEFADENLPADLSAAEISMSRGSTAPGPERDATASSPSGTSNHLRTAGHLGSSTSWGRDAFDSRQASLARLRAELANWIPEHFHFDLPAADDLAFGQESEAGQESENGQDVESEEIELYRLLAEDESLPGMRNESVAVPVWLLTAVSAARRHSPARDGSTGTDVPAPAADPDEETY